MEVEEEEGMEGQHEWEEEEEEALECGAGTEPSNFTLNRGTP